MPTFSLMRRSCCQEQNKQQKQERQYKNKQQKNKRETKQGYGRANTLAGQLKEIMYTYGSV